MWLRLQRGSEVVVFEVVLDLGGGHSRQGLLPALLVTRQPAGRAPVVPVPVPLAVAWPHSVRVDRLVGVLGDRDEVVSLPGPRVAAEPAGPPVVFEHQGPSDPVTASRPDVFNHRRSHPRPAGYDLRTAEPFGRVNRSTRAGQADLAGDQPP